MRGWIFLCVDYDSITDEMDKGMGFTQFVN